jgi:cysteine desulfurase
MSANNETGTLQPLEHIGELCASRGVLFHVDAVQSAGKESVELAAWQATSAAVSAHKFYGPKGAGLLWVAGGQSLAPLIVGGAQENQRRAGTENTGAIVGTAAALALAEHRRDQDMPHYRLWTEQIWKEISENLSGLTRNGHPQERVANTLHISVSGVNGEDLLMAADLEGLSLSSGSACMVGSVKPSHVITALGGDPTTASLRISLGRLNSADDVPEIVARLCSVIKRLRASA